MNARTKKRLTIVTLVIVLVMAVILALVGGGTAAKQVSLAEAATGSYVDQRIQVSGNVVPNSYTTNEDTLTFSIYDAEADPTAQAETLQVVFDGGVAATFGNDVTAICTGKMGDDGVLRASELVTKCPSKYESGMDALGVAELLDYGEGIVDKTVKVRGVVVAGTQNPAGSGERFKLADADDPSAMMGVQYGGALSDETVADGASLVLTGDLGADGTFSATDVAIENQ